VKPLVRRRAILEQLSRAGEVSFSDLAADLAVSEMTIRRDLESLEREGHLRRVRGGAVSSVSSSYEPPIALRESIAPHAKEAIGRAAAALVSDGDTLILDIGTTTYQLARALLNHRGLTVVTASLSIAIELSGQPDTRVFVVGGQVRHGELSLTGSMAEDALKTVNCDLVFIGVAGLRAEPGLTDFNLEDTRIKQAALRAGRRAIVLADSTKLGRVTFSTIARLSEIDVLVTDAPPDHPVVQDVAKANVQVVYAQDYAG
jgi:DeoR/GlpR family transcriptional regulator of sugar metabolism